MNPGDRVRLHAPPSSLTLSSPFGKILGPDPQDGDRGYWLIRLDEPAIYRDGKQPAILADVCEHEDNLTVEVRP